MKIIKQGRKIYPPVWRVTCKKCDAELEYGQEDMKEAGFDYRGEPWMTLVVCPNCKTEIEHKSGKKPYVPPEAPGWRD